MLRRMSLRSVPISIPSQSSATSFGLSIDGRTALFFDQVANNVCSVSTVDGSVDCVYQMPAFAFQYTARPKTWLAWAVSFFAEVDSDWKAIGLFCNKSTGVVGFFWNAASRTLHSLLFHANRKLKELVLLDSSHIDLPQSWGSVEPSVQQVESDYAVVITYTVPTDPMRRFLIVRCAVHEAHIEIRPKLTHTLPAGIWSWLGEYKGRVRLLLWNKKSMIEMTARGWEEIELAPDGDTKLYPPADDDCHCALPMIRNGHAWFCVFEARQTAENTGCLWQLDLAKHKWYKYPNFPVAGSALTAMRKLRNAIELVIFDECNDKQSLGLVTFIQVNQLLADRLCIYMCIWLFH